MKLAGVEGEVGETAGRKQWGRRVGTMRAPCARGYTNPSPKPAELDDALEAQCGQVN